MEKIEAKKERKIKSDKMVKIELRKPRQAPRNTKTDYKIAVNHKLKQSSKNDSCFSIYVEIRAKGKFTQMASAIFSSISIDEFTKFSKLESCNLILQAEKKSIESIIETRFNNDGDDFKMGDIIKDYRNLKRGQGDLLNVLEKKITTQFLKNIVKRSKFNQRNEPLSMCIFAMVPCVEEDLSQEFSTLEEYKKFEGKLSDAIGMIVPVTNEDSILLGDYPYTIRYDEIDREIKTEKYYDIAFLICIMAEFGVTEFKPLQNIHSTMLRLRKFIDCEIGTNGNTHLYNPHNLHSFFNFLCLDDLKNGLVHQLVSVIKPKNNKIIEIMEDIAKIEAYLFDDVL